MQAIKDSSAPRRLSEQEGVDCVTSSGGCNGGWMNDYWQFSKDQGSSTNVVYPYEASD